ncbi:protein-disulfide reductase DsbD [Halomonas nitroreducens]|uniref:Thiol:disulfide interchange protein DsbD n=1 Tax=Halomonas nitroreducens TaxID=447425 RepID=A0A431V913_9GAMM|nr:protein-disulfide reductase DsbD [Halomonas nitroreducens]RTR07180.1 protein-disulfide reductase DsbD [Halomonas nitroreducens]
MPSVTRSPRPARCLASLLLVTLLGLLAATSAEAQGLPDQQDDFLPPDQAFQLQARRDGQDIRLSWDIAPGYYLYRKRLEVTTAAGETLSPMLPPGEVITDEYFGEAEVYRQRLVAGVTPGDAEVLSLTWQGCADNGLCYAPQQADLRLADMALLPPGEARAHPEPPQPEPEPETAGPGPGEDQRLAERLAGAPTAWIPAAFFGMGLLLTFTPCVLPMIPILSSLVVGAGGGTRRGLALSAAFVVPMALTYALLGVAAGLAGANLQAMLQTPWLLSAFAAFFAVFALAMFGLFELQLPGPLRRRLDALQQRQRGGTLHGAALMGGLSALLVGPCMTAPLAGALLYIGDSGDALLGGAALLALGLGMGTPLLLVGALGARLLPRPGPWMMRIKALFGFVLLGMAITFLDRVIDDSLTLALWGAWLIGLALSLYQAALAPPARRLSRTLGLVLSLWGGLLMVGGAGGGDDALRPLAFLEGAGVTDASSDGEDLMARFRPVADGEDLRRQLDAATEAGRWSLVDVYADWCVSCQVIEDEVFGDPRVQAALADMRLLRPDVTAQDADDQALMRDHGIIGPPTLMLVGPDGEERRGARVVGEIDADAFLARLHRVRASGATP